MPSSSACLLYTSPGQKPEQQFRADRADAGTSPATATRTYAGGRALDEVRKSVRRGGNRQTRKHGGLYVPAIEHPAPLRSFKYDDAIDFKTRSCRGINQIAETGAFGGRAGEQEGYTACASGGTPGS